jgi:nickel-dependent lactate racemase
VLIPDGTRTMPMPGLFRVLDEAVGPRAAALDFLVALGTHAPMTDAQLSRLVGRPVMGGRAGERRIFNHHWDDPASFATLGTIPAAEIDEITGGRLVRDVTVALNKLPLEYDHVLICGPVFPHEVVGFSGGTKYLFPGIAGPEIIHFTHWLGALITNYEVIGTKQTPVRAVIDRAARLLDRPLSLLAPVVMHGGLAGLFCGPVHEAWSAAADGGEVVIYAPHVTEVSHVHGKLLDQVGYHCKDYFVKQWGRFQDVPGGILAHSTHVAGLGTYDPATGTETPRVRVTLATGIPRERCRRINLGYLDPASVDPKAWKEDPDTLVVPRAGEMLFTARAKRGSSGSTGEPPCSTD